MSFSEMARYRAIRRLLGAPVAMSGTSVAGQVPCVSFARLPSAEHRMAPWPVSTGAAGISSIGSTVNAAVFDNASAIGDDADADLRFLRRQNDLPVGRFAATFAGRWL